MISSVNYKISRIYLSSNKKQNIIAMLGVTFGISMYIIMTGFMTGVNNAQSDFAFSTLAHIRIYNDQPVDRSNLVIRKFPNTIVHLRDSRVIKYNDGIKRSVSILSYLKNQPTVRNFASQVNVNVFFSKSGNKVSGLVSGVEAEKENKIFNTSKFLLEGDWNDLARRSDGIFIGAELARIMSLKVNDNLNVTTSEGVSKQYTVIGIFRINIAAIDKSKAYINIAGARQLILAKNDFLTDIQINVNDYNNTAATVKELASVIPYKVESWQMSNQQLVAGSRLRDIIAISVSLTILLVAGFGIYNIMNMIINHKIKEIAILKAIGFSSLDLKEVFLLQAIITGLIGGVSGLSLGFLLSRLINKVPLEISGVHTLPMAYEIHHYLFAFMFGLTTTIIAGYLPARHASKIDPIKIIRG